MTNMMPRKLPGTHSGGVDRLRSFLTLRTTYYSPNKKFNTYPIFSKNPFIK